MKNLAELIGTNLASDYHRDVVGEFALETVKTNMDSFDKLRETLPIEEGLKTKLSDYFTYAVCSLGEKAYLKGFFDAMNVIPGHNLNEKAIRVIMTDSAGVDFMNGIEIDS